MRNSSCYDILYQPTVARISDVSWIRSLAIALRQNTLKEHGLAEVTVLHLVQQDDFRDIHFVWLRYLNFFFFFNFKYIEIAKIWSSEKENYLINYILKQFIFGNDLIYFHHI